MVKSKDFYDKYWKREGGAVPEGDPTTPERKKYLKMSLESLLDTYTSLGKNTAFVEKIKVLDAGCGSGKFSEFIMSLAL